MLFVRRYLQMCGWLQRSQSESKVKVKSKRIRSVFEAEVSLDKIRRIFARDKVFSKSKTIFSWFSAEIFHFLSEELIFWWMFENLYIFVEFFPQLFLAKCDQFDVVCAIFWAFCNICSTFFRQISDTKISFSNWNYSYFKIHCESHAKRRNCLFITFGMRSVGHFFWKNNVHQVNQSIICDVVCSFV